MSPYARGSQCAVMNDSTSAGERLNVAGSMSQKSGRAPVRAIVPAVAKKVKGLVITASPVPISNAINARSSASVPEDEMLTLADTPDGCLDLRGERGVLGLEIEERDPHRGLILPVAPACAPL